ncbi:MAG: N-formylglutamate amidohydrolase [Alphaproteobacteria bacterium]|jgi:predicted N-formylglutamate amidohydrolase|nr:N-formylglutamate amidohydrolase [Alphaproteobacteria bacterium]
MDAATRIVNERGGGPLVLACEHAANHVPAAYGTLGLPAAALGSHIAWDPGAAALAEGLSQRLDAPLVMAGISRLVYDCNRPPDHPGAMPVLSEDIAIPGNRDLSPAARAARVAAVYTPFHDALAGLLDARLAAGGRPPALVTLHSFTPVFLGRPRAVELGILHDADARLADALIDEARAEGGLDVRRNTPYGPADGVTHTLVKHALPRGLPNAMIEVRNDLLRDDGPGDGSISRMADLLSLLLCRALARLGLNLPDRA